MDGWKTVLVSLLLVIFGSLEQIGFIELIPAEYQGAVFAGIGSVMFFLRSITKTPIFNLPEAPKS